MSMAKTVKRMFALALIVALLAGFGIMAQAATKGSNYYCTANRVNLREGPNSGYQSLAKLNKGDVVTYITKDNGWYKVKFYKKHTNEVIEGYVYRKYLSPVSPTKSSKSSKNVISVSNTYKTTVNLRVRSEATTEKGYVKAKLKAGTKVTVLKQHKSWVFVTYKGGSGWVSAKYLKKVYK